MQVQQAVESALASFSARLSTAQGFLVGRGDSNPLGPEIMALVLHDVSQSLPISAQTRACWLLDGARIMGEELQLLYGALNDLLAGLGMEPADYAVVGLPATRTAGAAGRMVPAQAWNASQEVLTSPDQASDRHTSPQPHSELRMADRKPLLTLDQRPPLFQ